jgi:hypothetical protein
MESDVWVATEDSDEFTQRASVSVDHNQIRASIHINDDGGSMEEMMHEQKKRD